MNGEEGFNRSLISVAHELKTPLALMRQLTLELELTDDAARRAEIIRRIRLTAERSLRLADNLTKMARLDGAMFELEPIQLSGLLNEVVDELSPLVKALDQEIVVKVNKRPLVAVGHRELLRSLVTGLLDNALWCNRDRRPIDIAVRLTGAETMIAVRDHGAILDLGEFRQLNNSLGRRSMPLAARPATSSLGLIIANQMASAMHGRLSMTRHHSGGVTLTAHLPVSSQLTLLESI